MGAISSGHFSHDIQVADALDYLRHNHEDAYASILTDFPELADVKWSMSWFDTDAMGVDAEYSSWVADAIEATGLVQWFDGEPYAGPFDDDEED